MGHLTLTAADQGAFDVYTALPASGHGPGLVIAQEIFGVNQVMQDLCHAFADRGYVAVCPDLFWRQEPGVVLTDQSEEDWARAFELMQGFDQSAGVRDIQTTITALRGHTAVTGRVGVIGYCLGGKLAYLTAARTDADCAVGYYGVGIEAALDEAAAIKTPLVLHIAEQDAFVPPPVQGEIRDALANNPWVTIHSYPGVDHAFCRIGGAHFHQQSADLANSRTTAFLDQFLIQGVG